MKKIAIALLSLASVCSAQIFPPEGSNMPGSYDSFTDPPTINAFAGIQKVGGTFLLDTLLATRRYHTLIHVATSGGDVTTGSYTYLFTSGPSGDFFHNKWNDVVTLVDSVQSYTFRTSGGTDNSVNLAADSFYTVNFQDNGYNNTKAIWMSTATSPAGLSSVTQSPPSGSVTAGTPVTVSIIMPGGKAPQVNVYVRYTTNNFASSSLALITMDPGAFTHGSAAIPGQPAGTQVKYYAFSTVFTDPTSDIDLRTLKYNNNSGANYSYTIPSPNYTITPSSGPNGSINPSTPVIVTSGGSQLFTFTPNGGYYVDSILVDNTYKGDSTTYQFTNVTANHSISVKFSHNVNETFQVNMGVMRKKGFFRPDSGDIVSVNGSFNGFTPALDTLTDPNNDSIYTKTISIKAGSAISYKFWKTLRASLDWENDISNRTYDVPSVPFFDTIPVAYFDNQFPNVNVTFQVYMGLMQFEGNFRPDSGDVVTVRGSFNDFGNSTNNPDTLKDPNHDSIYTRTVPIPGNQTIQYKYWKTLRNGQDYEIIPPNPFLNRSAALTLRDTVLPVAYYNNDNSSTTTDLGIAKGWNMVSVPRTVSDSSKTVLFPTAISQAFGYSGSSYVIAPKLFNSKSYWLKFASDTTVQITGTPRAIDSADLQLGWNMIGTITAPLAVGGITSVPPGLVVSRYFGYSHGYSFTDTLRPGKGYWVKSNGTGKLVLNQFAGALPQAGRDPLADLDRLTVRDARGSSQTLYFGAGEVSQNDLPPAPLADAFDARFSSNRIAELVRPGDTRQIPIRISGAAYPLTISWIINSRGSQTSLLVGKDVRPMVSEGSVRIGNPDSEIRLLAGRTLPPTFALAQNYPNPFNPTTRIDYDLPEQSAVELTVFNILGERVAVLISAVQPSGYHFREWDGRNDQGLPMSSGVYFYSLKATGISQPGQSFSQVKKMLLVR